MTDAPHFARPFRIVHGAAVVNEQDSLEEIEDCCVTILRTQIGTRLDIPTFGINDQTLNERVNIEAIKAALNKWEPRSEYDITSNPDALDALIKRVTVNVKGETDA